MNDRTPTIVIWMLGALLVVVMTLGGALGGMIIQRLDRVEANTRLVQQDYSVINGRLIYIESKLDGLKEGKP